MPINSPLTKQRIFQNFQQWNFTNSSKRLAPAATKCQVSQQYLPGCFSTIHLKRKYSYLFSYTKCMPQLNFLAVEYCYPQNFLLLYVGMILNERYCMKMLQNFLLLLIILFLWAAYFLVQWTTYLLNMWKLNLFFTWSLSWNLYPGANDVTGSITTSCTLVMFHSPFWMLSRDTQRKVNYTYTHIQCVAFASPLHVILYTQNNYNQKLTNSTTHSP